MDGERTLNLSCIQHKCQCSLPHWALSFWLWARAYAPTNSTYKCSYSIIPCTNAQTQWLHISMPCSITSCTNVLPHVPMLFLNRPMYDCSCSLNPCTNAHTQSLHVPMPFPYSITHVPMLLLNHCTHALTQSHHKPTCSYSIIPCTNAVTQSLPVPMANAAT